MNREIPCVTSKALFVYVLLKVPFCSMFDSHPFYVLRECDASRMNFSFMTNKVACAREKLQLIFYAMLEMESIQMHSLWNLTLNFGLIH